jgi:rhodanese-related sulfurtransferase
VHLPLASVETRAPELFPSLTADIVVYCASATCANSHTAAAKLAALGYTNVRVFTGGKAAWTAAGLALEGGAS